MTLSPSCKLSIVTDASWRGKSWWHNYVLPSAQALSWNGLAAFAPAAGSCSAGDVTPPLSPPCSVSEPPSPPAFHGCAPSLEVHPASLAEQQSSSLPHDFLVLSVGLAMCAASLLPITELAEAASSC